MSEGILHKYYLNNGNFRINKWFHYFDIYERHLARFVGKSPVMVEIGVLGGGSLRMWKDFLGGGAKIIGIDINPDCKKYECPGIEIFIGSQDNSQIINQIFDKYQNIDIVLDDGSHLMHHMIKTFDLMYNRMNSKGLYIVEDTHTCYWEDYGGGLRSSKSFIEFVKGKIDELNAPLSRDAVESTEFTRSTSGITFYDSMVVFEKNRQGIRQSMITQGM